MQPHTMTAIGGSTETSYSTVTTILAALSTMARSAFKLWVLGASVGCLATVPQRMLAQEICTLFKLRLARGLRRCAMATGTTLRACVDGTEVLVQYWNSGSTVRWSTVKRPLPARTCTQRTGTISRRSRVRNADGSSVRRSKPQSVSSPSMRTSKGWFLKLHSTIARLLRANSKTGAATQQAGLVVY